jgi:predicted Zn-dependent peptidase
MSLPILGKIQNMYSINRDMIVNYHRANYYGSNFIVVGGGGINHEELCGKIEKNFSKARLKPEIKPNLPEKPKFTNEVFLMESDLT